jgi:hypothetical protein
MFCCSTGPTRYFNTLLYILFNVVCKAVSFEDMVIAIQTQLPPIESDYRYYIIIKSH